MNRFLLTTLAVALATPVLAFDRQHSSHEHGAATMLLAIEDNEIQLRIESPAANLLGFEYAPRTDAEKQQLKQAVKNLRNADNVVQFPGQAECRVKRASVLHTVGAEDVHEEHAEDDHDHKHEEHGHDEHKEQDSHSDFIVEFRFECGVIAKLNQVDAKLFSNFPLLETLDLQYIAPQGQGGAELTAKNPVFRF